MLPLAQVSRHGQRVALWGQVRPGTGPQQYVIQQLVDGTWTTIAGPRFTNANGFFSRTVAAPRGLDAPAPVPEARHREPAARRSLALGRDAREQRFRDQLGRPRDVLVRQVEMGDGANHRRMDRRGQPYAGFL